MKNRIKTLREHFNLSQSDFAKRIGVDNSTVSSWEKGGSVSSNNIMTIARTFQVNLEWLKTGEGDMLSNESSVPAEQIDDRLRMLRKHYNDTQKTFALRVGVSYQTLVNWENKGSFPESQRERICKELGINRQWLETGEGEMFNKEPEPLALEAAAKSSAEKKVPTPKETPREFAKRHGCNDVTAMIFENFLSLPEEEQEEFVKLIYRFARESRAKE